MGETIKVLREPGRPWLKRCRHIRDANSPALTGSDIWLCWLSTWNFSKFLCCSVHTELYKWSIFLHEGWPLSAAEQIFWRGSLSLEWMLSFYNVGLVVFDILLVYEIVITWSQAPEVQWKQHVKHFKNPIWTLICSLLFRSLKTLRSVAVDLSLTWPQVCHFSGVGWMVYIKNIWRSPVHSPEFYIWPLLG